MSATCLLHFVVLFLISSVSIGPPSRRFYVTRDVLIENDDN